MVLARRALLGAVLAGFGTLSFAQPLASRIEKLIAEAGNADDEQVRLEALRALRQTPGIDESLVSDLDRLIPCIERWNDHTDLAYFRPGKEFQVDLAQGSPLHPILAFCRARQSVQHTIGASGTWGGGWGEIERARELMRVTVRAFPGNRIARMYLGEPIPAARTYEPHPDAPEWANLQREVLERMADVMEWWIDHRQRPDGQYGGGWGDDVELWRKWYGVLIPFEDPKLVAAQARLSRGLWRQPHMKAGYTSRMSDVEHTAEDSADSLAPMLLLEPDRQEWAERARRIAELVESRWTGRNDRGFLQFKSIYFNAFDVEMRETCDTTYHSRVLHPVLIHWLRSGDETIGHLVSDWMRTWVDATRRRERGKPAGVLPSAILWPSGTVGGTRPDWWNPIHYTDNPTNYYTFPSQLGPMTLSLLLTHHLTGDESFLEPLRSMARIRLEELRRPYGPGEAAPGSRAWCAQRMQDLSPTLAKYRLLTGRDDFDELLLREEDPLLSHRLRGDLGPIVATLQETRDFLRENFEAYTSELRVTDRLFAYPEVYGPWRGDLESSRAGVRQFDPAIAYQLATGDPGGVLYFPLMAARWLTPPRELAAFVTDWSGQAFRAELFHFGSEARSLAVELYALEPGRYTMTLASPDSSAEVARHRESVQIEGRRTTMRLRLPPRQLVALTLEPVDSRREDSHGKVE